MAKGAPRSVFRFLNLSAELRNRVYDFALYHDRAEGHLATVSLLRVCKQINDEAKNIIYEDSAFAIVLTCRFQALRLMSHHKRGEGLNLSGDTDLVLYGEDTASRHMSPGSIYSSLPRRMLEFATVKVNMKVCHCTITASFLYAFACFLASSDDSKVKEVHVHLDFRDRRVATREYSAMCYGLSKLPAHIHVHLTFDRPEHAQLAFQAAEVRIRFHLLKNSKPHPARPAATACDLIGRYHRVKEMFERSANKVGDLTADPVSEMWLTSIKEQFFSHGHRQNAFYDAYVTTCADLIEARATKVLQGKPLSAEQMEEFGRGDLQREDAASKKWDRESDVDVRAEFERLGYHVLF